jgi:hypothetical protein
VYLIFHDEWLAAKEAIASALKHNKIVDVIIARDSKPLDDLSYFKEFSPIYLETSSCMELFYRPKNEFGQRPRIYFSESLSIINCYVNRLEKAAQVSNASEILCLEPDSLIRGRVKLSSGTDLECLTVNKYSKELLDQVNLISNSKIPIEGWGFCVGLVSRACLLGIASFVNENQLLIADLIKVDEKLVNIDHGLPIFAHLAGFSVSKSGAITEVGRNRFWRLNRKPIVHQYKKYYPKAKRD